MLYSILVVDAALRGGRVLHREGRRAMRISRWLRLADVALFVLSVAVFGVQRGKLALKGSPICQRRRVPGLGLVFRLCPVFYAFDFLELKAAALRAVGVFFPVDLAQKHRQRPDPQGAVTVELTIDHIFLACFRVPGDVLDEIVVPLKCR